MMTHPQFNDPPLCEGPKSSDPPPICSDPPPVYLLTSPLVILTSRLLQK